MNQTKYVCYTKGFGNVGVRLKTVTVLDPWPAQHCPGPGCDILIRSEQGHINSGKLADYSDTPEEALRRAIEEERGTLRTYQPVVDAANKHIEMIEGMLRDM